MNPPDDIARFIKRMKNEAKVMRRIADGRHHTIADLTEKQMLLNKAARLDSIALDTVLFYQSRD